MVRPLGIEHKIKCAIPKIIEITMEEREDERLTHGTNAFDHHVKVLFHVLHAARTSPSADPGSQDLFHAQCDANIVSSTLQKKHGE